MHHSSHLRGLFTHSERHSRTHTHMRNPRSSRTFPLRRRLQFHFHPMLATAWGGGDLCHLRNIDMQTSPSNLILNRIEYFLELEHKYGKKNYCNPSKLFRGQVRRLGEKKANHVCVGALKFNFVTPSPSPNPQDWERLLIPVLIPGKLTHESLLINRLPENDEELHADTLTHILPLFCASNVSKVN